MSLISWWEDELTCDERSRLMEGYSWHGTVEQRHTKLQQMYDKWSEAKTSATPTSKEGMELPLNPIPSQTDNKNNNGSGTKPLNGGI